MIRVEYYEYGNPEKIFDGEYSDIEQAEDAIAEMHRMRYFNDKDGYVNVFVDGVLKELTDKKIEVRGL